MARELDPGEVQARLDRLRASWRPLGAAEARALMEPPASRASFAQAVGERLAELRALDDLTRHLHSGSAGRP